MAFPPSNFPFTDSVDQVLADSNATQCVVGGCGRNITNKMRQLCCTHYTKYLKGVDVCDMKPIRPKKAGKKSIVRMCPCGTEFRVYSGNREKNEGKHCSKACVSWFKLKPNGTHYSKGIKCCERCQEVKSLIFFKVKTCSKAFSGVKYSRVCTGCSNDQRQMPLRYVNPSRNRKRRSISKYNLTLHEFDQMNIKAGYQCQICSLPAKDNINGVLSIDHCHSSGLVRGLLCNGCNSALGQVSDSPARLEAMLRYLQSGKVWSSPSSPRPRLSKWEGDDLKYCRYCSEWKEAHTEFNTIKRSDRGYMQIRTECKACQPTVTRSKLNGVTLPENPLSDDIVAHLQKDYYYYHNYGISFDLFTHMTDYYDGCAICHGSGGGVKNLGVDHDHKTGSVRGILCNQCNWALGLFKDSIENVCNAIDYLKVSE